MVHLLQCGGYIGAAHLQCGAIGFPALLLRLLPCNIGVTSMATLLSSCFIKGNASLGAFSHLRKAALISKLVN